MPNINTAAATATAPEVEIVKQPANAVFRVDAKSVQRIATILGLTKPIKVSVTTMRPYLYGDYQPDRLRDMGYHAVRLNKTTSVERINETIWHELQHAVQYEGIMHLDNNKFVAKHAKWNSGEYRDRPIEVEARMVGARWPECPAAFAKGTRRPSCGTSEYRSAQKKVSRLRRQLAQATAASDYSAIAKLNIQLALAERKLAATSR